MNKNMAVLEKLIDRQFETEMFVQYVTSIQSCLRSKRLNPMSAQGAQGLVMPSISLVSGILKQTDSLPMTRGQIWPFTAPGGWQRFPHT